MTTSALADTSDDLEIMSRTESAPYFYPEAETGDEPKWQFVVQDSPNHTDIHGRPLGDAESSTEQYDALYGQSMNLLANEISKIFWSARTELFEDGVESEFSLALVSTVNRYGSSAIDTVRNLITMGSVNAEVASEALRWLGLMGDAACYIERRELLIKSLFSHSERIRDGATLGVSFLGDPAAITWLEKAIDREPIEELRQDMALTLAELVEVQEQSLHRHIS